MHLDDLGRRGVEGDQEIRDAQAGAVSGGQPTYLGRDNAHQITFQDGLPGIPDQYRGAIVHASELPGSTR